MTNWKRPLPYSLKDRRGRVLRTLTDARAYVLKLKGYNKRQHWQKAAELMIAAADGGDIEACTRQIKLALLLDGLLDVSTP